MLSMCKLVICSHSAVMNKLLRILCKSLLKPNTKISLLVIAVLPCSKWGTKIGWEVVSVRDHSLFSVVRYIIGGLSNKVGKNMNNWRWFHLPRHWVQVVLGKEECIMDIIQRSPTNTHVQIIKWGDGLILELFCKVIYDILLQWVMKVSDFSMVHTKEVKLERHWNGKRLCYFAFHVD